MMRLYITLASPYSRKVRAVSRLLDLPLEEVVVDLTATPKAVLDVNPLGKVPALVLADGTAVFDSPVIVQTLDHLSGGRLLPVEPMARLAVLRAEALMDGILDSAIGVVLERRRPPEMQMTQSMVRYISAITRALDAIESTEWAAWSALPSALPAIALVGGLEYLDLRFGDIFDWRQGRPNLVAAHGRLAARPELMATRPA